MFLIIKQQCSFTVACYFSFCQRVPFPRFPFGLIIMCLLQLLYIHPESIFLLMAQQILSIPMWLLSWSTLRYLQSREYYAATGCTAASVTASEYLHEVPLKILCSSHGSAAYKTFVPVGRVWMCTIWIEQFLECTCALHGANKKVQTNLLVKH